MTKFLSIVALAAFLLVGGVTTASAHCGKCGDGHAKSGEMKPCEKCMESMKSGKKEPCKKCAESEKGYVVEKTTIIKGAPYVSGTVVDRSNIGSLQMQSRGNVDMGYNN